VEQVLIDGGQFAGEQVIQDVEDLFVGFHGAFQGVGAIL
jgi:hypothetical protein